MYSELTQWVYLEMEPADLGPDFSSILREKIRTKYEGKLVDGNYYLAVDQSGVEMLSQPAVQDGTCLAIVKVKFPSIVYRPFKNEVIYTKVSKVHKVGLMAHCGPLRVFVPATSMEGDWKFVEGDSTQGDRFVGVHDGFSLTTGKLVCCRIQGVRAEESGEHKFHALATITEEDLGPIRQIGEKAYRPSHANMYAKEEQHAGLDQWQGDVPADGLTLGEITGGSDQERMYGGGSRSSAGVSNKTGLSGRGGMTGAGSDVLVKGVPAGNMTTGAGAGMSQSLGNMSLGGFTDMYHDGTAMSHVNAIDRMENPEAYIDHIQQMAFPHLPPR
ncbi:unnamed protein product [Amoebophrya sp. A25]|nr:unnamed protein product [Amoebophrya sp. A25]|eukprot:GSA25T00018973001.1